MKVLNSYPVVQSNIDLPKSRSSAISRDYFQENEYRIAIPVSCTAAGITLANGTVFIYSIQDILRAGIAGFPHLFFLPPSTKGLKLEGKQC